MTQPRKGFFTDINQAAALVEILNRVSRPAVPALLDQPGDMGGDLFHIDHVQCGRTDGQTIEAA